MQKEDPIKLIFEGLEMRKWNRSMDRAQRLDEKNGVTCLIFIFTFGVTVNAMPKMVHFLHFMLMTARHQSQFGQNVLENLKGLIHLFQKVLWIIGFWATISKMSALENTGFRYFLTESAVFLYFYPQYLTRGNFEAC